MPFRLRRKWPLLILLVASGAILAIQLVAERLSWLSSLESYRRDNYSLIDDGLYLGGILSEAPPGIRAVLNVCETENVYEVEAQRWDPIADTAPAPSLDWLKKQVQFVDEQVRAGRPVFVHCRAGISRGGMVMTAYLMWRDRCTRDEALAAIRTKRPSVRPNPAFMELLLGWEKANRK